MAYALQGNFNPQKHQITSTQLIDNTNSAMTASHDFADSRSWLCYRFLDDELWHIWAVTGVRQRQSAQKLSAHLLYWAAHRRL